MPTRRQPTMSDAAIKKATGKTWAQWFTILDKFPKTKPHYDRARWLYHHHLRKGWWSQMVSISYEQARGLRAKHESGGEFKISASKTVPIPIGQLYALWTTKRTTWLKVKGIHVTSATNNKYLHAVWPDNTRIDVFFYAKGPNKSNLAVQHRKLKSSAAADRQQRYWRTQLERLAQRISRQSRD